MEHDVAGKMAAMALQDSRPFQLFDLPFEIRAVIFEHAARHFYIDYFRDSETETYDPDRSMAVPADFAKRVDWIPYKNKLRPLRLVSRQFRNEFFETWASSTLFEMPLCSLPPTSHDSLAPRIAGAACGAMAELLQTVGSQERQYIRRAYIHCVCPASIRAVPQAVRTITGDQIARLCSPLQGLSNNFKLEVVLQTSRHWSVPMDDVKRTMILQQQTTLNDSSDAFVASWSCVRDDPVKIRSQLRDLWRREDGGAS